MDGVLINSEPLHRKAWLEILTKCGIQTDDEELKYFTGIPCSNVPPYYEKKIGMALDSNLLDTKEELYQIISEKELAAMPGVKEVLDKLTERNLPIAIASSSTHETIRSSLKKTGLDGYFSVICSGLDVKKGKPEPDVFLYAASKLGVMPEACMVVEDAVWGIMGAKKAGMFACGYTSSFNYEILKEAGADYVFDNYDQLFNKICELTK
jgi:HAD superfamily hydrolase (TIGR01509 family)